MAKIGSLKFYIIIGLLVAAFVPPFAKYQELRYKNGKLEEKIAALKEESRRLEETKRRLETDITYVEKKAREKIGVVRKGEIILKEVEVQKKRK